MEPLSRGEILTVLTLIITFVGVIANWLVVPQVQKLFEHNRKANKKRNNRMFLIYTVILICIFIGLAILISFSTWRYVEQAVVDNEGIQEEPNATPSPEPNLSKILKYQYESVNIGGAVVLIQTAPDIEKEEIAVLFEQIADKSALVNLALDDKLKIEEVILNTKGKKSDNSKFSVSIKIKNLTNQEIEFTIPKGQIFENKDLETIKQNLAATHENTRKIPALGTITIDIDALCINKGLAPPDGGLGNITIFELKNKSFINQTELWKWIGEKLEEINK